ncbi:MAG: alpha/beta hydrolase [Pseudomonadota bacterium]|mgnify:CR=1 FL=1|uniref:alpha/beta hydrolase n=1 Tax=Phenylobacterium sp. TaxID=1871053 RepID=UPI0025EFC1B6|nr:alpha/beta hydrolase [Phenylobacterium sp.]
MLRKLLIAIGVIAGAMVLVVVAAVYVTPWPGALLIRHVFEKGSADASAALEKHVPAQVTSELGLRYDPADPVALLDIYRPAIVGEALPPTIVWIHGGGYVSGRRGDMANYLKVLAGQGFTTVAIDYSIAPRATYPTPVRQANAALAYLTAEAQALKIDPSRLILAGDSAGAQIAAQMANIIASPVYARAVGISPAVGPEQIRGVLLFCGPYDVELVNFDGPFAPFLSNVLWSYSGSRNFRDHPEFSRMSVTNHVTAAFPPAFISVGDADPLEAQSRALAKVLQARGVAVETLFFPQGHQPALGHEYQFNIDQEPGQQALARSAAFVRRVASPQP